MLWLLVMLMSLWLWLLMLRLVVVVVLLLVVVKKTHQELTFPRRICAMTSSTTAVFPAPGHPEIYKLPPFFRRRCVARKS